MSITEPDLYTFSTHHKLAVLSSLHKSSPQSALIGIAITPKLEIIFDTVTQSRKYRNLKQTPNCSLVIGCTNEQTLQYEGLAHELTPPQLNPYLQIYCQAWPDAPARQSWPCLVYFLIQPTWIRFSDYAQAPPRIQEFTF